MLEVGFYNYKFFILLLFYSAPWNLQAERWSKLHLSAIVQEVDTPMRCKNSNSEVFVVRDLYVFFVCQFFKETKVGTSRLVDVVSKFHRCKIATFLAG